MVVVCRNLCTLRTSFYRLCRLSWKGDSLYRRVHTAGVIVIGDEILKGQVKDTNSNFLAREIYRRGYKLQNIIVVPDDVKTISDVMSSFSASHNIVFTTGGIGPTHDDVTYEALANTFNEKLYYNPIIVEMCKQFFKTDDLKHPSMKLALIPLSAKLTFGVDSVTGQKSLYPNISLKNIFVFPGVPHLCERMFNFTCNELFPIVGNFFTDCIYLNVNESDSTPVLNKTVELFPNVVFGSYPKFFHSYYTVKISLESLELKEIEKAAIFLKDNIPGVFDYDDDCFSDKSKKLNDLNNPLVNETMDRLRQYVLQYKPENLYLYFDGGKNSTLLLHFMSIVNEELKSPVNLIYVEKNKHVTKFVKKSAGNYNTNLLELTEINFKRFHKYANITLIKGIRGSDPNFQQVHNYFSKCEFLNPIFEWSYHDVWNVIRILNLPYCDLYDRGFSSLSGNINPKLLTSGPRKDLNYYKGAFLLENE